MYLFNTFFKEDVVCWIALVQCFGLHKRLSQQICQQLGFGFNIKPNQLTQDQKRKLAECISQNYKIANDLQLQRANDRKRLSLISCYRGFRHSRRLPCRGQRTHGNSKTVRKLQPY